jgi:phage terminase small subunit
MTTEPREGPAAKRKRLAAARPPVPPADPHGLNPNQRAFVLAYVANGWKGPAAYRAAYPNCTSENSSWVESHRLLRSPKVRAALKDLEGAMWAQLEMSAEEALALVACSARANLADAYDEHGQLLPFTAWPRTLQAAVRSRKGEDIVLNDQLKAREMILISHGRLRAGVDVRHSFDHEGHLAEIDREIEAAKKPAEKPKR